jgi:hypothetical protein
MSDKDIDTVNYPNIRHVPRNCYSPNHEFVKSWVFGYTENHESEELQAMKDANLADAIARVAASNGLTRNDVMNLFPAILRMLKSESEWAK